MNVLSRIAHAAHRVGGVAHELGGAAPPWVQRARTRLLNRWEDHRAARCLPDQLLRRAEVPCKSTMFAAPPPDKVEPRR